MTAHPPSPIGDRESLETALLNQLKVHLPELEALLVKSDSHWHAENGFYRFYHQSFKVYHLQTDTQAIVAALGALMPERRLNETFLRIVGEGTGKIFQMEHNERWLEETRPILEAFFHARMMLQLAVKYGRKLDSPPVALSNGWAAVLYLYRLR